MGATVKLEGSITEIDGDRYRTNVTAVSATIDGDRIAEQAKALLEQQVGAKADSMTCPETIEIPTTHPVRCELAVGATHLGTSVTIDKDLNLQVQVNQ